MNDGLSFGLTRFCDDEQAAYLGRIGVEPIGRPDAKALEALHHANIHAIVFENLDIHLGRPIEIDVPRVFDKIIRNDRGGFCYELNALFGSLLVSLGYDVSVHAARVVTSGSRWIPFGHVCLTVKCEGKDWLVDVGFGNSFQRPLEIGKPGEQSDVGGTHILSSVEEGWLLSSRIYGDTFDPEYRFDLEPRHLDEFKARCKWTQTDHTSGFTRNIIATLPTPRGRRTVLGLELREFVDGAISERKITAEQRATILIDDFGLPRRDVEALPQGVRARHFPEEVDPVAFEDPPATSEPTV
jgi:N-hydroxyarylamine O-acetyltransferase